MKNIRQLAARALLKVDSGQAWSNLVLDNLFRKHKLDSRDGAFCAMLFYGVLERGVTLDACIRAHSKTPFEKLSPQVIETLRIGLYQILYMDSVPDRAAVDESVELVRVLGKPQAAGFVNGVLRSFLRADKHIPIPAQPLAARLGVEYSCPVPIVELWLKSYGEDFTRRVLAKSLGRAPLYIRVNTLLITPEELISRLTAHDIIARPDDTLENCLILEKSGAVYELPEFKRGFFHVQDKASQICAQAIEAKEGERVLDACAAPGGKSFTIAECMNDVGEVVACDLHEHRAGLITARAKKMKIKSIRAEVRDMSIKHDDIGVFDKILCDVPCSGLGAMRRKPEIKRKKLSDFENLPDLQYKILETTSHYLKAGGRMVYSTCTLNPAENEDVVRRFLDDHPDFAQEGLPVTLGGKTDGTFMEDADGFFIAILTKNA